MMLKPQLGGAFEVTFLQICLELACLFFKILLPACSETQLITAPWKFDLKERQIQHPDEAGAKESQQVMFSVIPTICEPSSHLVFGRDPASCLCSKGCTWHNTVTLAATLLTQSFYLSL